RSLRAVVNHILVAVRSAALSLEQRYGKNVTEHPHFAAALAELTVPLNAAMTAYQLRQELRPEDAGVRVVYSVYDLGRRLVGGSGPGTPDLAAAPETPAELMDLGLKLAAAPRVAAHLT